MNDPLPAPAPAPGAWAAWCRWADGLGTPALPAAPEAVATIRGSINGSAETLTGTLTMAIIFVMADAGLRRSEVEALEWRDERKEDDGSGRVTTRRSKTDQEDDGAVVAITPAAMADLERLRRLRPAEDHERVFALSASQIARRITAAAKAAGGLPRWWRYTRNEAAGEALRYL